MRPAIENLKIAQGKDGFAISYTATCKDKTQGLRYEAKIEAQRRRARWCSPPPATPLTDFLTNRTGFVVLHPLIGVVGEPVEIVHTDGKKRKAKFPKFISPGQPVFEIRSLKHTVMPGVTATVLMEGNKFEMEDHRNWMDASYKTYVCSLLDPWPYTLKKGEPFTQSITVTIEGKPKAKNAAKTGSGISVDVGGAKGTHPGHRRRRSHGGGEACAGQGRSHRRHGSQPPRLPDRRTQQGPARGRRRLPRIARAHGALSFLEIVLPAKAPAKEEVAAIAKELRAGGLCA